MEKDEACIHIVKSNLFVLDLGIIHFGNYVETVDKGGILKTLTFNCGSINFKRKKLSKEGKKKHIVMG